MTGSPAVIEALNEAYRAAKAIEEQAHLQEHWLEAAGFKRLSDWFDDMEEAFHKAVIHELMKRVNRLGARLTPGYAFEPAAPADAADIESACRDMLDRLATFRDTLIAACNDATDADDYPTQDCVRDWIGWVDHRIRRFEKRLAKIQAVGGIRPFLAEMLD